MNHEKFPVTLPFRNCHLSNEERNLRQFNTSVR